jgi:hypothetical protein
MKFQWSMPVTFASLEWYEHDYMNLIIVPIFITRRPR